MFTDDYIAKLLCFSWWTHVHQDGTMYVASI